MTAVPTFNTSNTPSSPAEGSIYWNTDSKSLHIADGNGDWHTMDASSRNVNGRQSQLGYPNGIYSSGAGYTISTQPAFHFDASHVNGSTPSTLENDDPIPAWGDCSGNGYDLAQSSVANQPSFFKNSIYTDSVNEVPFLKSSSDYFPASPLPAVGDNATFFCVHSSQSSSYATPFSDYGNWIAWNQSTGTQKHFGAQTVSGVVNGHLGTALRISRKTGSSVDTWGAVTGNSPVSATAGSSAYSTNVLHTYSMITGEIIMFDEALSISEINTVKDYLVNKYGILVSKWAPLTLTD